jgi:hypothetical protein
LSRARLAGTVLLATALLGLGPEGWATADAAVAVGGDAAGAAIEAQSWDDLNAPYDGLWHFVRVRFGGGEGGSRFRGRREPMWAHDYPRAERNFLKIVTETTLVSALTEGSNVLALDERELFSFPAAYIVEPGFWQPTEREVSALGDYIRKGGFLIVDDFRGPWELDNLEVQLKRALPEASMLPVADTDEIFDAFFRITPAEVVPPYGGQAAAWYGIYEDNDPNERLQVIINHNNDLAEYWEYSDYGYYPIDLSNEAYKLGVNYVVYALTH